MEIQLTRNQVTQVDAEDFAWLSAFPWYAAPSKGPGGEVQYRAHRSGSVGRKTISMATEIVEHVLGRELVKNEWVDHKDRNPLNNRRENLRIATPSQNGMNRTLYSNNTSGYRGVSWDRRLRMWVAAIGVDYEQRAVGWYDDPVEAARAYDTAAKRLHGDFASLNFPT